MVIVHLILLSGFAYLLFRNQRPSEQAWVYWSSLSLKLCGGILVGLFYMQITNAGDTLVYDQEAKKYTVLFMENPAEYFLALVGQEPQEFFNDLVYKEKPRALFFTRILSVAYLITNNNYWISSLYFSFFAFTGLWLMIQSLVKIKPLFKWPAYLSFLYFPSMIFWSSGILKESVLLGLIGFIMHLTLKKWDKVSIGRMILLVFLWVIVWYLKYHIAAIFIPFWIVILAGSLTSNNLLPSRLIRYAVYSIPVIFIAISFSHTNLDLSRVMDIVLENHNTIIEMSQGENYIHMDVSTPWSLLKSIPKIYFLGWFGPLIAFDSIAAAIASIENIMVLGIFIWFLFGSRDFSMQNTAWLFLPLLLIILLCTFFLTLSTPVYGTLLRYKVAYFGFFLWILLINHPINHFLIRKFPHNI